MVYLGDFAVVIPAFNEESSIASLLHDLQKIARCLPIVVSDGSVDRTAKIAKECGAVVLDLPCNLGVGGAVQAGICEARRRGFNTVIRLDGDGQHDPRFIPQMLKTQGDIVIGSRFLEDNSLAKSSTKFREYGNGILAGFLSLIGRTKITDPTSGFWLMRGAILDYFANFFPCEYPEPEAIALARRQGYEIMEIPIIVRPRMAGVSSISPIGTIYFMLRVALALLADRVRPIDTRFAKNRNEKR